MPLTSQREAVILDAYRRSRRVPLSRISLVRQYPPRPTGFVGRIAVAAGSRVSARADEAQSAGVEGTAKHYLAEIIGGISPVPESSTVTESLLNSSYKSHDKLNFMRLSAHHSSPAPSGYVLPTLSTNHSVAAEYESHAPAPLHIVGVPFTRTTSLPREPMGLRDSTHFMHGLNYRSRSVPPRMFVLRK